jgi:cellulose biosynthesis protein BcsQ
MLKHHLDEARQAAITAVRAILDRRPDIRRAVLIEDLFGQLRLVLWSGGTPGQPPEDELESELKRLAAPYWTSEFWVASEGTGADEAVYNRAWEEARPVEGSDRLRIADRYRNRSAWMRELTEAPWQPSDAPDEESPPIIVYYSFKGGVGRSTAIASFAVQRARAGERVVVVDFDLDAPGVGVLLAADEKGTTASWGVVDYMLERPYGDIDLRDYHHACRRSSVTHSGEILVFPAGRMDAEYLGKLARTDLEPPADKPLRQPLVQLLDQIRTELKPKWLLIDARAGLSESAGVLLGGMAHLYVLFGTASEQSWQGLRLIIQRLGAERVLAGKPQLECVMVQSLVPENAEVSRLATAQFAERARDEFSEYYYAPDPDDPSEDRFWYVRDAEDDDAPHAPVALSYQPRLSHFRALEDVADQLAEDPEYRRLAQRISERFLRQGSD